MQQDHRLLQFIMKLDDKYATVRGNILMQQLLPTPSNVFRIFPQEKKHQQLSQLTTQTESLAFVADNKRFFHDNNSQKNFRIGPNNYQKQSFGFGRGNGNSGSSLS